MAYRSPGTTVIFQDNDTTVAAIEAELPLLIVGPLYEVFEKEASDTQFDPLTSANQAIAWPNLRVGSVVDLAGTRSGYIDSQRRRLADYVPTVYLVDGTNEYLVDDDNLEALDQTGFELLQTARTGLDRGTLNYFPITVNDSTFLYNPEGGLSAVEVGDVTTVGATDVVVATVSDTRITTEEDISGEALSGTRVAEDEGGSITLDAAVGSTPGRVVYTITGSDFATEVAGIAANDVVIGGSPLPGFSGLAGAIDDGDASYDEIDGITFGTSISLAEVDNYIVRVVNSTVGQTYFTNIVAIDTDAGTIGVADAVGTADGDVVSVTIMTAQAGYVESLNSANDELTVVFPDTFSGTSQFVDVFTSASSSTFYPLFDVAVSYRALRKDLADQLYSAGSLTELLSTIDHDAVDVNDKLAWAVNVGLNAQPNNRDIYFIPVDVEPDGTTGLPANLDLTTGYTNALTTAESADVYMPILLNRSAAIDSVYQTHISSMSTDTEKAWRRGFLIQDVPLGETESETGLIEAGRTTTGTTATGNEGNKVIRDDDVDFVTGANVVAGTQVVVTFPEEFAGTYTALGTTTDNDLILDGDPWTLTKEFEAATALVTTSAGQHVFSGGAITSGQFVAVEAGDYVEATVSGTTYRLPVVSVNAAGDEITCSDDVPGDLDLGTGTAVTDLSVIRTFGPSNSPAVEYYIRPLTKAQMVTQLVNSKSVADRRITLMLNQAPTMETGTDDSGNPIEEKVDPSLTLVAAAAKRSGLASYQEVTNQTLGGGLTDLDYAYNYFKRSQLDTLAEAGFTLVAQRTATSSPYIRDMITSSGLSAGLVQFEELVTANADWIGKTLVASFGNPIGAQIANIGPELLGLRAIQLDALLRAWVDDGRLIDYQVTKLEQNASNKRQIDIEIVLTLPVAEKEIEFVLERSV